MKRPPGYKDGAKDGGGVGDFLIWKTIATLGEQKKEHLIFVSEEESGLVVPQRG